MQVIENLLKLILVPRMVAVDMMDSMVEEDSKAVETAATELEVWMRHRHLAELMPEI